MGCGKRVPRARGGVRVVAGRCLFRDRVVDGRADGTYFGGVPPVVTVGVWSVRGRSRDWCWSPLPGNPRCCCVRVCQSPVLTGALAGGAPVPIGGGVPLQEVAAQMKVMYERVAGIDVHKQAPLPPGEGRLIQRDERGDVGPLVADHDALLDQPVLAQPVFQDLGRDVLAARGDDQVLLPAGDVEVPVVVAAGRGRRCAATGRRTPGRWPAGRASSPGTRSVPGPRPRRPARSARRSRAAAGRPSRSAGPRAGSWSPGRSSRSAPSPP